MSTFHAFRPFSPEHLMERLDALKEGSKETRRVVVDQANAEVRVDLDVSANAGGQTDFSLPIQRRFVVEAGAILTEIVRQYDQGTGNLTRYTPMSLFEMVDWRRY